VNVLSLESGHRKMGPPSFTHCGVCTSSLRNVWVLKFEAMRIEGSFCSLFILFGSVKAGKTVAFVAIAPAGSTCY